MKQIVSTIQYKIDKFPIDRFFSNSFASGAGFHLRYEAIHGQPQTTYRIGACGGNFTHPNGILTSPLFPENYPYDADCIYLISVPLGNVIQIDFLSLDIDNQEYEYSGACSVDYLEIRDGPIESSPFLGRLCGSDGQVTFFTYEGFYPYDDGIQDVPDPIQSSLNHLRLR